MSAEIELKVGQRWVQLMTGRTIRIMAIAEGYCMARFKGGMPFVIWGAELKGKYGLSKQALKETKNEQKKSS
jgi:hypothetical protein